MRFVFDLDDTICDTNSYSEEYIKNFIKKNNLPINFVGPIARFAETKFDWDKEAALKWYKTYGDEMMLNFPVKNNAVNIINSLYDAGHTIIICTARETDWHTDPNGITMKWIKKVGLKYSKFYIGRCDKEKVCEEEHADIFIDDDINIVGRVVECFNKIGHGQAFLMNTDYNQKLTEPSGSLRVNNLNEMLEILNK